MDSGDYCVVILGKLYTKIVWLLVLYHLSPCDTVLCNFMFLKYSFAYNYKTPVFKRPNYSFTISGNAYNLWSI